MNEWKEGALGENGEKDVQILESGENVQIERPEQPEAAENVQIAEGPEGEDVQIPPEDGGDMQQGPEEPMEPTEPIPPEAEEPVMPMPREGAGGEAQVVVPGYLPGEPYLIYPLRRVQGGSAAVKVVCPYGMEGRCPNAKEEAPAPEEYENGGPGKRGRKKERSNFFLILNILMAVAFAIASLVFFLSSLGVSINDIIPDENLVFGSSRPSGEDGPGFSILPPDKDPEVSSSPSTEDEEEEPPQVDVYPNEEGIVINGRPDTGAMDAQEVYNRVLGSTVRVTSELKQNGMTYSGVGTGIIATSDGYIITNSHVVMDTGSARLKVATSDGLEYDAVVAGIDRSTDIAVIKTNDYGFTPAVFGDSDELTVGEWVLAIGNPGGPSYSSTLTRGIVSGLDREVGRYSSLGMTYIQTDAPISPGNSGGPLVNMYGQVVGINTSKIISEGYEGIGFSIPMAKAQPIINQLMSNSYIPDRCRLGIVCREVSYEMAEKIGVPMGVQVVKVGEDCDVDVQLEPGDVITEIDGENVRTIREVSNLLLRYSPGDYVKMTLYRPKDADQGGWYYEAGLYLLEDLGQTRG